MSRFVLLLAVLLAFSSCSQPTVPAVVAPSAPVPNVFVVDSAWDIIAEATVAQARQLSTDSALVAEVAAYDSSHLDDQRRVYYESVPAIHEAPSATLTIADAQSNAVLKSVTVPRSAVKATREAMRAEAASRSGVLYVETSPPPYRFVVPASPPAVPPADTFYAWAVYVIYANDGAIKYEDHCESAAHRDFRVSIMQSCEVGPWNLAHPDDPEAIVWGQRYDMPAGVTARD